MLFQLQDTSNVKLSAGQEGGTDGLKYAFHEFIPHEVFCSRNLPCNLDIFLWFRWVWVAEEVVYSLNNYVLVVSMGGVKTWGLLGHFRQLRRKRNKSEMWWRRWKLQYIIFLEKARTHARSLSRSHNGRGRRGFSAGPRRPRSARTHREGLRSGRWRRRGTVGAGGWWRGRGRCYNTPRGCRKSGWRTRRPDKGAISVAGRLISAAQARKWREASVWAGHVGHS